MDPSTSQSPDSAETTRIGRVKWPRFVPSILLFVLLGPGLGAALLAILFGNPLAIPFTMAWSYYLTFWPVFLGEMAIFYVVLLAAVIYSLSIYAIARYTRQKDTLQAAHAKTISALAGAVSCVLAWVIAAFLFGTAPADLFFPGKGGSNFATINTIAILNGATLGYLLAHWANK